MKVREQIPYAWREVAEFSSGTFVKIRVALDRGFRAGQSEASGNDENLSRIGILHFLARGVTSHIHIAAAGIERTKDIARFTRDRLSRRKLGLGGRITRRARRWFGFFGDDRRGRFWTRAWAWFSAGSCLSRSGALLRVGRARRDVPSGRSHRIRSRGGGCCRRRLRLAVDMPANIIGRSVQYPE